MWNQQDMLQQCIRIIEEGIENISEEKAKSVNDNC